MGQQQRYIEENPEEHHYQKFRHKPRTQGVTGTMRTQVLRSSAKWSSGIELEVMCVAWWSLFVSKPFFFHSTLFKMLTSPLFFALIIISILKTSSLVSIKSNK
jgi:hypothetical protein